MTFPLRLGADHRPDVGGEPVGRADVELLHRRLEHLDHAVGDVVLQAQHTQGRAALAGGIEGGGQRVGDHLLGQRRRIDDQRVLAAGFGNQRDRSAVGPQPVGERGSDQSGDLGRTGEDHAADIFVRSQRRADCAVAGDQDQRVRGRARFVHQLHRRGGDQRRLFGRLGNDGVARRERRGDLAGEDGDREIPWADADDCSERRVGRVGERAIGDAAP